MTVPDCPFCEVAAGRAEASVVYADTGVVAFADTRPANPGHLLVIPTVHVPYLSWTDELLAGRVFAVAHQLVMALRRSTLRCDGVNLLLAEGKVAGQTVDHVHFHVVPRFAGDGFTIGGFAVDARSGPPERAELDEVAAAVRAAMEPEDPDDLDSDDLDAPHAPEA